MRRRNSESCSCRPNRLRSSVETLRQKLQGCRCGHDLLLVGGVGTTASMVFHATRSRGYHLIGKERRSTANSKEQRNDPTVHHRDKMKDQQKHKIPFCTSNSTAITKLMLSSVHTA
uniref:Uncharacterized protein n=1 Tax=Steinernema glaseri TaxID=37863 RepID=A0A1I7ZL08_9BILA